MNTDELFEAMQRDEQADARLMPPVAYGKLRGISPQLVYYHIRAKHLETEYCDCGRKCIEREAADDFFRSIGKLAPLSEDPGESSDGADDEDGVERPR
jgi:hypothetical protein